MFLCNIIMNHMNNRTLILNKMNNDYVYIIIFNNSS